MKTFSIDKSVLSTQGGVGSFSLTVSNPAPAAAGPAAGVDADATPIVGTAEAAVGATTGTGAASGGNVLAPKAGEKQ